MRLSTLLILIILCLSFSCKTVHTNTSTPSIKTGTIKTATNLSPHTYNAVGVDAHGVAFDTDGDGVPDYKDKELLTLQKCFPADSNGVGNCPDPECCKEWIRSPLLPLDNKDCGAGEIEILFADKSKALTLKAKKILDFVTLKMKSYPKYKIVIGIGAASAKRKIDLNWNRLNAVIKYISNKGIPEDKFIFGFDLTDNPDAVGLRGTGDEGPNIIPKPHPLKKEK